MNFLSKNKKLIDVVFVGSIILDFIIGYVINKVSQEDFDLFAWHNVLLLVFLILLIVVYIICQVLLRGAEKGKKRRLQKAFQDNGGYETVVNEMKICIENHDYKNIKELKKIVNYIER